jgi:DNA-binding MarR family transcriptional regulator
MKRPSKANTARLPRQRKTLEVLRQFRVIVKSIRLHYQDVERRAGISGAQLWSLARIARAPGIKVGELARSLAIHQSTASNLLAQLEDSKLIERRRQNGDRRTVSLFATARGRAVLRGAPRPHSGALQQALADLPTDNLDALHRQLDVLIETMKIGDVSAGATPLSDL